MSTRHELRARGEAMRARLFGPAQLPEHLYGYRDLTSETTYAAIWARPGLALPDRLVCTLAALCAVQQLPQLRRYVGAALNLELPRAAPFEIFLQIGIYAGFAAAEAAIEAAAAVYNERGFALPQGAERTDSLELLAQRGRALMDKLHGKRGVLGYAAADNPFTSRLYPMTIPYGYGEIWQRPGLELRQRALCSVAGFTALHLDDQLKKFGQSALNVGLSMDEVIEAIIQTAPYSGYAPALNALRWLSEVA